MTRIFMIRHGQTVWNAERRLQGQQDAPLTERGINQAKAVAQRLAELPLDAIYSSDLGRAVHTAEIVNAKHGLPLVQRETLREVNLGAWEGRTVGELEEDQTDADLLAKWRQDSVTNRPPGGERLEELQARVIRALEEIAKEQPEGRVAVVTHGGVIKAAVTWILGLPISNQRRFEVENGSLTRIQLLADHSTLITLNDVSHWEADGE